MRDFRKLKVWEKAHETALMVYAATKHFPREERYGLGSASELEYDLLLASDLGYLDKEDYERITLHVTEVKRMLTIFIQKLKAEG